MAWQLKGVTGFSSDEKSLRWRWEKGRHPAQQTGHPSSSLHFWATLSLNLKMSLQLPGAKNFLFLPENISGFTEFNRPYCWYLEVNSRSPFDMSITGDLAEWPFPSWTISFHFRTSLCVDSPITTQATLSQFPMWSPGFCPTFYTGVLQFSLLHPHPLP